MRGLVLCGLDEILADDVPMWGWQHGENSQLSLYAYKGDVENLKRHFTRKNINERGLRGYSPLMWACTGNKIAAVQYLLDKGANVNHTDDVGATPLHVASWYGRKLIVQALILNGADVNVSSFPRHGDRNSHTPLHFACIGLVQAVSVIKLLLASGANLNARNGRGQTPLHLAVSLKNDTKKAKTLLKAGSEVNATDRYGHSPLHIVGSPGHIRLLLEFGADLNLGNERDQGCGFTPLHFCFISPDPDITMTLLEYGAGAHVLCNKMTAKQTGCCDKTVLMCCYSRFLDCGAASLEDSVDCFEKHFIRSKVCGLYLEENNNPTAEPHENDYWTATDRDEYRLSCEAEFAQMSDEIGGLAISYKDILYQRPFAIQERSMNKILTLEHCEEKFPEYGGLIHRRFIMGQRRLHLVESCHNFFDLTTPPLFEPYFREQIFSYLDIEDLQVLSIVCRKAVKKRASHQRNSKGRDFHAYQRSAKVSKKDNPDHSPGTSSQQISKKSSSESSGQGTKLGKGTHSGSSQQRSKVPKGSPGSSRQHSKKNSPESSGQGAKVDKETSSGSSQQGSKVPKSSPGSSRQHVKKSSSDSSGQGAKLGKRTSSGFYKQGSKVPKGSPGSSRQHSKKNSSESSGQGAKPDKRTSSVFSTQDSKVHKGSPGSSQQHSKITKSESAGQGAKIGKRTSFVSPEQRPMRSKRGRFDLDHQSSTSVTSVQPHQALKDRSF